VNVFHFFFDASALAKRYTPETGTDTIDVIFDNVSFERLMCSAIGALEVFWICVRKRNDGRINARDFSQATLYFRQEVLAAGSDFQTLSTSESNLQLPMTFIEVHAINSTDALVLASALEVAQRLRTVGDDLVLVASDQRLLRAAQAEGLSSFNPETDSRQALASFIEG